MPTTLCANPKPSPDTNRPPAVCRWQIGETPRTQSRGHPKRPGHHCQCQVGLLPIPCQRQLVLQALELFSACVSDIPPRSTGAPQCSGIQFHRWCSWFTASWCPLMCWWWWFAGGGAMVACGERAATGCIFMSPPAWWPPYCTTQVTKSYCCCTKRYCCIEPQCTTQSHQATSVAVTNHLGHTISPSQITQAIINMPPLIPRTCLFPRKLHL